MFEPMKVARVFFHHWNNVSILRFRQETSPCPGSKCVLVAGELLKLRRPQQLFAMLHVLSRPYSTGKLQDVCDTVTVPIQVAPVQSRYFSICNHNFGHPLVFSAFEQRKSNNSAADSPKLLDKGTGETRPAKFPRAIFFIMTLESPDRFPPSIGNTRLTPISNSAQNRTCKNMPSSTSASASASGDSYLDTRLFEGRDHARLYSASRPLPSKALIDKIVDFTKEVARQCRNWCCCCYFRYR